MKRLLIFTAAWCALSAVFALGWAASRGLQVSAPDAGTDAGWSDYRAAKGRPWS